MTTTKTSVYTIKLIDELGNCYHEENVKGFMTKQKYVKNWLNNETYSFSNVGDITCLVKSSGSELWYYENNDTRTSI